MKRLVKISSIAFYSLALLTLSMSAWGYEANIGRVSNLDGKIFFQSGRALDWAEGYMNSPVQEGDRIWTDIGTFAELQLIGSVLVRLDSDTKLDIIQMGNSGTIMKLWLGNVYVRVVDEVYRENPIGLDTPDCALDFLTQGLYRIDVTQDNTTMVRIYEGVADIQIASESLTIKQGESLRLSNGQRISPIENFSRATFDNFGRYNEGRDELLLEPESGRHVHDSMSVGVYELDYYGIWVHDVTYGFCWRPRVFVGWVPYRFGRWIWDPFWGWTWTSFEPWGWLPYHYGYWHYTHYHGWMWKPDHYYAPAWVAWTAHSHTVGWVPMHPDDPHTHYWRAHHGHSSSGHGWGAHIANPKNSSLHIGINASTHISFDRFKTGHGIKNVNDLTKVNRSDIKDWKPLAPASIKPERQTVTRLPSNTLHEKSKARTWTRESQKATNTRPSSTTYRKSNRNTSKATPAQSSSDRQRYEPKTYRSQNPERKSTNPQTGKTKSTPRPENTYSNQLRNDSTQQKSYERKNSRTESSRKIPSYRQPYDTNRSNKSTAPNTSRSTGSKQKNDSYRSKSSNTRSSTKSSATPPRRNSNVSSKSGSKSSSKSTSSKSSKSSSSSSSNSKSNKSKKNSNNKSRSRR